MKKLLISLSSLLVLLFTGCGGGGGGDESTPAEPNTNVYDLRTFFDTGSFLIEGSGTLTAPAGTIAAEGTYQNSYQGTSVVTSGETVHNHDITITLISGVATVTQSSASTSYMGNFFSINNVIETEINNVIETDEYNCTVTLPLADLTPLPIDAKVGYVSNEVRLECDNDTYMTNVIELNDAGGGNAEISINYNIYASLNDAHLAIETDNIVVNASMAIKNADISGRLVPEDVSYTFSSTLITQP